MKVRRWREKLFGHSKAHALPQICQLEYFSGATPLLENYFHGLLSKPS